MQDHDNRPNDGSVTAERLYDCRAEVWWADDAEMALPTAEERRRVLDPLEATMRRYGTTTLYYHAEEIDGHSVAYQTAEDEGCIYAAVRIAAPMLVEGFDFAALLSDAKEGVDDSEVH